MCYQLAGQAVASHPRLTQRHFMRKTQNLLAGKCQLVKIKYTCGKMSTCKNKNTQTTNTFSKQQWQQVPVHSQLVMFQGTAMPGNEQSDTQ